MKRFANVLLLVVLGLLLQTSTLATVKEVGIDELTPEKGHLQATAIITKVIAKHHYKETPLDDKLSEQIFNRYLEALDANKSYFTQQDVDHFAPYKKQMDDFLRNAKLDIPFEIFRLYRRRVEERVADALKLLRQPMDFTVDESYRFDREKAPWAKNPKELDEIWRLRVKNDVLNLRLSGKEQGKITETLERRYEGIARRVRQLVPNDLFQTFINAYTLSIEPHTSYMSPRAAENFDIGMRLSLEGIGAVLSSDNEYTRVQKVVPGGPAALSREVRAGDRILSVAQGADADPVDVLGWRLQDVVDQIRGPKGSVVRLRLQHEDSGADGPTRDITLVRNEIKLEDQAAKKEIVEKLPGMGEMRIGVIDLPTFYRDFEGSSRGDADFRSTTRDVRRLLKELRAEQVDGIVIDLRDNGGGALTEATELTGLFIPTGPVVQVRKAGGELELETDNDPEQTYDGPLAVLVDRYSASASEIFAGAIQDYGRGLIIGETTYGKGTVQTLVELNRYVFFGDEDLGRLRLTMAQFFRVNGGSTQFKGVEPDIAYPTAKFENKEGERSQDNALPWAEIKPAKYKRTRLGPLDEVRGRSHERIKNDPGFRYLTEELNRVKEVREEHTVSLLESKRKQEWEAREQQRKANRNAFRATIGLAPVSDEEDKKKNSPDPDDAPPADDGEEDEETKAIKRIGVNEAAHVLADYIAGERPRAVMAP